MIGKIEMSDIQLFLFLLFQTQIGSDGCVVLEASQSIELFNRVDEAKKQPLTGMDGLFNSVVDDQNRRLLLTVNVYYIYILIFISD